MDYKIQNDSRQKRLNKKKRSHTGTTFSRAIEHKRINNDYACESLSETRGRISIKDRRK